MKEWVWQERHAIRSVEALGEALALDPAEVAGMAAAGRALPVKVTPYYLSLVDRHDPHCPIRRQILPDGRELISRPEELADPIGDQARSDVPRGVVHRYADRVLLLVTRTCGTTCRHCFRRSRLGQGALTPEELDQALAYIRSHHEVHEAILTGGDPLILPDEMILPLVARLRAIPTLRTIRIHSRMAVVNPHRITYDLAQGLAHQGPLWLVTQFNHGRELTDLARTRLSRLQDRGVPVLNQAVLLKGVNDRPETLRELVWALLQARIQPYYLHHPDLAQGTSHLRPTLKEGLALMRALRGTVPGYAVPRYVLDVPGGKGKIPLEPPYLRHLGEGESLIETLSGEVVTYPG